MKSIQNYLSKQTLRKVPEVIALFWITKLLTTAMGESTSDFLVHTIDPVIAVAIGAVGFGIGILLQFRAKKYNAWIYWFIVAMVALFGTMAADIVHIVLGVPYVVSTIAFSIALALVFLIWFKTEHTLSIHSINTPKRELFYWLTVVTTFALGTAAGDTTAVTLSLGYLHSGFLFGVLFIAPLLLYKLTNKYEVFTFWFAYIMTRPLGASFADWFGRTPDLGGLGFGTGRTSIVLAILILLLVFYLSASKIDTKSHVDTK